MRETLVVSDSSDVQRQPLTQVNARGVPTSAESGNTGSRSTRQTSFSGELSIMRSAEDCLSKAAQLQARADLSLTPDMINSCLDMVKCWHHLAEQITWLETLDRCALLTEEKIVASGTVSPPAQTPNCPYRRTRGHHCPKSCTDRIKGCA
jgi:hypothetical protein